jgi:hypothetical protein
VLRRFLKDGATIASYGESAEPPFAASRHGVGLVRHEVDLLQAIGMGVGGASARSLERSANFPMGAVSVG